MKIISKADYAGETVRVASPRSPPPQIPARWPSEVLVSQQMAEPHQDATARGQTPQACVRGEAPSFDLYDDIANACKRSVR